MRISDRARYVTKRTAKKSVVDFSYPISAMLKVANPCTFAYELYNRKLRGKCCSTDC